MKNRLEEIRKERGIKQEELAHWKYLGRLSARWKTDDIILRLYWRLSLHGILI